MQQFFKLGINDQRSWPACQLDYQWGMSYNEGKFCSDELEVEQTIITDENTSVISQKNVIKNIGNHTIKINRASSVYLEDVVSNILEKEVIVHYCHFAWSGEGQWITRTLDEFGIYPIADHMVERNARTIGSVGSWSTEKYYPIMVIENKTEGKTWFFEHLGGMSWEIELGIHGKHDACSLTVDVNALNENQSNTYVELNTGESYTTAEVLYGCVDGGFDTAIEELLKYKRAHGKSLDTIPVCFNDYMNCLWANPSDKKLIPLIDAAAEVGAEIFCIDDGWFINDDSGTGFGDWIEDNARFGSYGFWGIIEHIRNMGMIPGIWFELETCTSNSAIFHIAPDAVLKRGNRPIGECRCVLNFRCKKVTDYLYSRIAYFYNKGIRYIKNDYNHSLGIGCDNNNTQSMGYGIIENDKAFCEFIDRVTTDMPELVIENCGSGAMRCDHGTLQHFHLQSISDHECYLNNPSILWGVQKCMVPEKCGIWSYPYPLTINERELFDTYYDDAYMESMKDGNQTIFNMAATLFGVPFISGHIEKCDTHNRALIAEAVQAYKEDRNFVKRALPLYVYPQQKIHRKGYSILALKTDDKIRLGIFKNHGDRKVEIDLSQWCKKDAVLNPLYPVDEQGAEARYKNGVFTFESEMPIVARVYEIKHS